MLLIFKRLETKKPRHSCCKLLYRCYISKHFSLSKFKVSYIKLHSYVFILVMNALLICKKTNKYNFFRSIYTEKKNRKKTEILHSVEIPIYFPYFYRICFFSENVILNRLICKRYFKITFITF